jgi:hypothetical protein
VKLSRKSGRPVVKETQPVRPAKEEEAKDKGGRILEEGNREDLLVSSPDPSDEDEEGQCMRMNDGKAKRATSTKRASKRVTPRPRQSCGAGGVRRSGGSCQRSPMRASRPSARRSWLVFWRRRCRRMKCVMRR